jgi:membrane-associated HD superfamily phosphohydrolase
MSENNAINAAETSVATAALTEKSQYQSISQSDQYYQLLREKELIMSQEKQQLTKQNEETNLKLEELKKQNEKMAAEHQSWLESTASNMFRDHFKAKGGDDEDFETAQILLGLKTIEKPQLFLDKDGKLKYKKNQEIFEIESLVDSVINTIAKSRQKTTDPRMIQALIKEKEKIQKTLQNNDDQKQNQNKTNTYEGTNGRPIMMSLKEANKSGNF